MIKPVQSGSSDVKGPAGPLPLSPLRGKTSVCMCVFERLGFSCSFHAACISNCSPDTQINYLNICVSAGENSPSDSCSQYFSKCGRAQSELIYVCFLERLDLDHFLYVVVYLERNCKASLYVWRYLVRGTTLDCFPTELHCGWEFNKILYASYIVLNLFLNCTC